MILKIHIGEGFKNSLGGPLPDFDKMLVDIDGRETVEVPMFGRLVKLFSSDMDRVRPEALTSEAEITEEAMQDFLRSGSPALAASIVTQQIAGAAKDSTFPIVVDLKGFSERIDGKWARLADLVAA